MAKIHGRFGSFFVSDDSGSTYTLLGGVMDIDPDGNLDEVETTTKDSGPVREYIKGRRDLAFTVSALWDETDPGQIKAKSAYYGDTNLFVRFRLQTGSALQEWLDLDTFITTYSPGSPNDDASTLDLSFRVTGAHTPTAQP